ncbi:MULTISPECIES: HupE/UreJ family protein [unclassified Psychrobacter]|uniref:HupE/UreJ family protein n=1 Tax=unclassified Psychrobacter TaxID=196806 RepID=UPI000ED04BFF|nr:MULTISPECIES: HupE/UreJ family protein [unclassified Psychrobacter]MBE8610086.1 HupE/UreJ family protein [Pseudomonas lundensis]HCI76594.1 urease accessory protein UreJ [Psychrobacter sp.]
MTTDTAKTMTRKNIFQKTTIISSLALLSLLPTLAFAHPGHGLMAADGSFSLSILSGILHPLTGFDHLMLALGMGMLFTQMYSFKKGFVALLIGLVTGFLLSLSVSLNSLFIEYGILLSIVLLTMALMSRYFNVALNQSHEMSVKTVYKFLVIGFGALAMFHGAAHAIEVPANSNTAGFFTGMIVAMLGLYTIGKGFATYLNTHLQDSLIIQRVIAVVGLCGVLLG